MNANQLGAVFEGRLPTARELENITQELGVQMATGILLKVLQDSKLHGAFARKMRDEDPGNARIRARGLNECEVAVIASNHFASGREWGDHVDSWRAWAREMGFTTELIETEASLSVAENARRIRDFLKGHPHPKRILVSYGQGSTEVRYLLHRLRALNALDELDGLRGWLNVCGAVYGSSLSSYLNANFFRRLQSQLRLQWQGRSPLTLAETSSSYPLWKELPPIPKTMTTVNIVGISASEDLPVGFRFSYDLLSKSQPNDGVVKVLEAIAHPGFIVPVQGMNHRLTDFKLKPVFQRTLLVLGRALEETRPLEFQ